MISKLRNTRALVDKANKSYIDVMDKLVEDRKVNLSPSKATLTPLSRSRVSMPKSRSSNQNLPSLTPVKKESNPNTNALMPSTVKSRY